jgi:hypothetical protein
MLQERFKYTDVVNEIAHLNWTGLTRPDLLAVSEAYYFFSVQFCETVEFALYRYPTDPKLIELKDGECNTANLSPYPGIAEDDERMNHDEFMRRANAKSSLPVAEKERISRLGAQYLAAARTIEPDIRIHSLPSYEDGGLETVFRAALTAPDWNEPALKAFHHFLSGHVALDSDPEHGHGSLCRHLIADDRILPLWTAFRDLLTSAAPNLLKKA